MAGERRRLKGNLHAHTTASDGDSPPGVVARWYDDHGYDFLVISDHNVRVATETLQEELRAEGRRLLLVPGEELTHWWQGPIRVHALHVNGTGTTRTLGAGSGGDSVVEVLQGMIDRVLADGAVPSLNHPNFWRSVTLGDMMALRRLTHFEVYNGHPLAHSFGAEGLRSMEEVWDALLAAGRQVYGVAVDDAHHFRTWGPDRSNPGRGWVVVEAEAPEPGAVVEALRGGRFYASTGPELGRVEAVGGELVVEPVSPGRIEFVAGGAVVAVQYGQRGCHPLPDSGYLRAGVIDDTGRAWTQPVFR